jgi:hypothetical protein
MNDNDTIYPGERQTGKTTWLVNEALDLLTEMRAGERKRAPIHIVTPDHVYQKQFMRRIDAVCDERGIDLAKQDNVLVFSERSMEHQRGGKPGYVFVDSADLFEAPIDLVESVWPDALLTMTYTPS